MCCNSKSYKEESRKRQRDAQMISLFASNGSTTWHLSRSRREAVSDKNWLIRALGELERQGYLKKKCVTVLGHTHVIASLTAKGMEHGKSLRDQEVQNRLSFWEAQTQE